MTSLRATHGSERILSKLRRMMDANEYYEAHQLYRTLHFRYMNARRFKELEELLYDGAAQLLKRNQISSGADVACLYLEAINEDQDMKSQLTDDKVCLELSVKIGELLNLIPAKTSERVSFIMNALKLKPDVFPLALIHYQFALVHWREKNFSESRYHFLYSPESCGEDCALMLIEYHVTAGYPSEVDLFIAQFILQLLCVTRSARTKNTLDENAATSSQMVDAKQKDKLHRHSYANRTLRIYASKHPNIQKEDPPFLLPLLNFLWFLLLAIDSGKSSTFKVLCDLYAVALKRDPSYKGYLSKIGELYFGLRSPSSNNQMSGILGNLLQAFFDDGSDDNEPESQMVARSSKPQQEHVHEDLD